MPKLISVFLFVVMFTTATMHAQTLPQPVVKPQESKPNLSQVFSKETQKIKSESSTIDAKKMEKVARQNKQSSWSKNKMKWIVALILVSFAVVIILGVKYTKRCIRREPRGCDFSDTTTPCECLEYAQDDDD
jgi:cobalamin biosynthesis Mg chelatase CobN